MKNILLITIIALLFSTVSYGQTLDPNSIEFHLKKRKANKTAGWLLVSIGTIAIGGGIALDFSDNFHLFEENPPPYNYTGKTIAILGGGMVLTSIPCFISAHKHKKLAETSIAFKKTSIPNDNFAYNTQHVLAVTIKF